MSTESTIYGLIELQRYQKTWHMSPYFQESSSYSQKYCIQHRKLPQTQFQSSNAQNVSTRLQGSARYHLTEYRIQPEIRSEGYLGGCKFYHLRKYTSYFVC